MAAFPDKKLSDYMPGRIQAHGWLLFEQEKMSKSKGNVAYAEPIVKALGNDALRYYLLREVVFGQDGNFSKDALITRYNADLANGLGNLASRVLTMIERNLGGLIPSPSYGNVLTKVTVREAVSDFGVAFQGFEEETLVRISEHYSKCEFSQAVTEIWGLVATADRYLSLEKPWIYADDQSQRERLEKTLFTAAEALRIISILAYPVIPEATQKIWRQLGRSEKLENERIDKLSWPGVSGATRIGKLEGVFPRADKKEILERIETMENEIRNPGSAQPAATSADAAAPTSAAPAAAAAGAAAAAPAMPAKIGIEDFAKVELRAGIVKSAERIQGADKLLKLLVDIGDEVRQVLAGIALSYAPEDLVGRKVVIVTNLAPRKMRGLESNGMLLAASVGPDGKPVLCTFAEDVPAGAKVK
jgi:methionyl-tRNA synthetase